MTENCEKSITWRSQTGVGKGRGSCAIKFHFSCGHGDIVKMM